MKTILITIFAIVTLTGCAAIQGKKLARDIDNYTHVVTTVCEAAELFSAVGKEVPMVVECKEAVKAANLIQNYGDTLAVVDVLECVDKNEVKSVKFVQCVQSVKWWPVLVDRINKEIGKKLK